MITVLMGVVDLCRTLRLCVAKAVRRRVLQVVALTKEFML